MRTRPVKLGLAAAAAGLTAFGTAGAQTPPAGPNNYSTTPYGYTQPKTAAPASGGYPTGTVRPYSDWTPAAPGAGYTPTQPVTPQPAGQTATRYPYLSPGTGAPAATGGQPGAVAGRPRPTSTAMTPSDGVKPASYDIPPPNFGPPTTTRAGFTPPAEPQAKFPPALPEMPAAVMPVPPVSPMLPVAPVAPPAPASVGIVAPVAPPPGVAPKAIPPATTDVMAPPAAAMTPPAPAATATLPTAPGGLPARMAPSVVVEAFTPETVNYGQEFKYDLVVRNVGPVAVKDVRVDNDLPAGSKFVGSEPAAELSGDRLGWTIGSLDAGAEKRIVVRVKPSEEGEVRSRATVSFAGSVDARTRVTRPKVTVALTGPETCRAGEEATFLIKVSNTGTGPAAKLVLKAKLTDGLFCSRVQAAANQIETVLPNVMPGETKTIKLPVAAARAGMQACEVSAAAEGSPDSEAKSSVNVVEPLLQVKQSGPAHCLVRGEPVYTIELTNPGTASTDPVQVVTVLPDGFEFVQASDNGAYTATTRAVSWRLASLAVGGSRPVSVKLRAAAASDGVLRTVALAGPDAAPAPAGVAQAGMTSTGGRTLEAKAETAVRAEGVPAIRFEVAATDGVVEVGKEAVYEIRVTNQGTGACTNVVLAAALADGMAYTGSSGPTGVKAQGQQLTIDPIPTLGVKGEAVYRVRVRGNQPGEQRFRVQLTCDQVASPLVKEESTKFYKE